MPAQTTIESFGDSPIAKIVVCISADELSTVTPPDCSCFCLSGSFVVRSGEMRSHVCPIVARAEEELRADVERAVLRGAHVDRRVPVEAQLPFLVAGQRLDVADLVRLAVDAADVAALRFGVEVRRVGGIDEHPEAVAAVHVLPLRLRDAAGELRLADPRAVVLQAAVHVVRPVHVDAHVIELRDRQRLRLPPLVAAVVRVPEAAVVAGDQVVGVLADRSTRRGGRRACRR